MNRGGQATSVPPGFKRGLLKSLVSRNLLPAAFAENISNLCGRLNASIHRAEGKLVHCGLFSGKTERKSFSRQSAYRADGISCRIIDPKSIVAAPLTFGHNSVWCGCAGHNSQEFVFEKVEPSCSE